MIDTSSAFSILAAANLSQDARLLSLQTPLADSLTAERFTLTEGVSRLFELVVDCLSTSTQLDVGSLLGREISVDLLLADRSKRRWHAVVTGVDALGADGGLARYRIHGRPWLQALAFRRDSYIYQDKTTTDILAEIFSDYPLSAYAYETSADLPKRAIRTQYRESDLEFALRIMAEDGLSFRFVHQQADDDKNAGPANSQGAGHRLVVFDAGTALAANAASPIRFHRSDATETSDTITAFHSARVALSNTVTRSAWDERALEAHAAQLSSHQDAGVLPQLEDYDYDGHGRYADGKDATRVATLRLQTLEARQIRYDGGGTVRQLAPGETFEMTQHDRYDGQGSGSSSASNGPQSLDELGNRYTVLAVTHEAANNLGSQAASALGATDLERGRYVNRFHAQPQDAAVLPAWRARPTAPEAAIAVVVAAGDGPLTSDRDHRVKVQFPWQRGKQPLAGGLPHVTHGDDTGNAPGDDSSGTWLRVATGQAGPNWGGNHLPRAGTEVLVEFMDGDIDRPVLSAQLYNDSDLPPWSAGVDGGANHAGTISGWHSTGLDGAGHNQWLFDDTSGQGRMHLSTSTAATHLNLGHIVEQSPADGTRGAWRGSGFEMRTDAWAVLRSGKGMLLSSNADPQASATLQSPQAVASLRGAQNVAQRLSDTAVSRQVPPLQANASFDPTIKALDPQQDGKHPETVNGQSASKASFDTRDSSTPVDNIDGARVLVDAPVSLNLATPASAVLHASGNLHTTAHQEAHIAAQQTFAVVAGQAAGIYSDKGGIQAIAGQSPVSLRAHTDALELMADKGFTVTSSEDSIEILAKQRITLQAGGASVTLEGGNITFKGPGVFSVKAASHSFDGPASDPAKLPQLPQDQTGAYTQHVVYKDTQGQPFEDMPFDVQHKPGEDTWRGGTQQKGETERVYTAQAEPVEYGLRYATFKFDE